MPQSASRIQSEPVRLDAEALLGWYDRHARTLPWRVSPADRKRGIRPDPYRVWLSEIMLQQTTVVTVGDYFHRFITRWPTVADLAAAPLDDVLVEWAGLGYYARARNMHKAARAVMEEHGGTFPETAQTLLTLPGVGPYTAAAIAAICYDEPVAVVDGNVDRVMARIMALGVPVRDVKDDLRAAVQANVPERAGDFAQAMMDLGATICAPRSAACMLCPLEPDCAASDMPDPTLFPVKPVKAQKPVRYGHAYLMQRADGAFALKKRPETGLLAQMTEVPGSDWHLQGHEPAFPVKGDWRHIGDVSHTFTHFRLELVVWALEGAPQDAAGDGWWCPRGQLADQALPTLFKKVLTLGLERD